MKNKLALFGFTVLICVVFSACENRIMGKWWGEPETVKTIEEKTGGSGDNFGYVVFNTDGGTPQPQSIKIAWGGTIGRLRPVNRGTDGFLGWFDEKGNLWDVETRPVTKEDDVDSDGFITLTIRWQQSPPLIYTVEFITDPSPVTIPFQLIGAGGKVIQPVKPPALDDGRAFAGWYLEKDPEYRFEWDFNEPPANDITLYAKWEIDTRIVIFEPNEGLRPDGITELTREYTVALSYGLVQDPGPLVREGFHFAGWYMYPDFTGLQWNFATKKVTESDVPVTGTVTTLYAKWEKNIYFVDFVVRPSTTAAPDRQLITHGEKIIRPADPPMLGDGRAFYGWYMDDIIFNNPWKFDNDDFKVTGNITLYAKFAPQTRTVHFQPNGGLTTSGIEMRTNFTIPVVSGIIMNPGSLVRTGYTFGGWFTDPECTISWNFITDRITTPDEVIGMDPMYLYAKWTTNPYIVTFEWHEAADPLSQTQSVNHGERAVRPNTPANPDRYLIGWFTEDGTGSSSGSSIGQWGTEWNFDTRIVTNNMTLYANWVDAVYTVEFVLRNPPGGRSSVFIQPDEQHLRSGGFAVEPIMPRLPESEKSTLYSFVRWDYSTNNTDDPLTFLPYNFNTPVTGGDLTLYARWIPPDPDMVWIPRGSFIMGDSGVSGSPASYHAYPTRRVTLDGFFIGRYPVIQGFVSGIIQQPLGYTQVMPHNPSQFTADLDRPVERVSWFDAIQYCINLTSTTTGLSQVYTLTPLATVPVTNSPAISISNATVTVNWASNGYRLPTEAEWEYAAKGGNGMGPYLSYSGSNDPAIVAWYNETVKSRPAGVQTTQPVGLQMLPNDLGIYHMSGNVSEWVWDRFMSYKDYIAANPADLNNNPKGPATGTDRVRRGGAWSNAAGNVRSVVRNSDTPDTATWVNGFRVVRGPSGIW